MITIFFSGSSTGYATGIKHQVLLIVLTLLLDPFLYGSEYIKNTMQWIKQTLLHPGIFGVDHVV